MAISLDNNYRKTQSILTNPTSFSYTVAGADRMLVVAIAMNDNDTVTGITYNGVALTKGIETSQTRTRAQIWYLVNPATGSNTLEVTYDANTTGVEIFVSSWNGVGSIGDTDSDNGDSDETTVSILTTELNSCIVECLAVSAVDTSSLSPLSGQTELGEHESVYVRGCSAYEIVTSIATYDQTYDLNPAFTNADFSHVGIELVEVEDGSPSESPSSSESASASSSESASESASESPSSSESASESPSESASESASQSPSSSESASESPSESSSQSPSSSESVSQSPSSSESASVSESASTSPSSSESVSESASQSPSSSVSPSASESPSSSESSSSSSSSSASVSPSASESPSSSESASASPSPVQGEEDLDKTYGYKIYDKDGKFITTWKDVIIEPVFLETINGGLSELTVELARLESDFGEGVDVKHGNLIEVWAYDEDDEDGVQIYGGILTSYTPTIDGRKETVKVTFFSYYWQLNQIILENGGATTVAYNSYDPTLIARDLIDKFVADGGTANYGSGTLVDTETTVSYTFNTISYQDGLKKVLELCPENWYFRVGVDGTIYMKAKSATPEHYFTIGRDISFFIPEKRTEGVINTIYFSGGDTGAGENLFKKYTNSSSVTEYGTRAIKIADSRVTVEATADNICNKILNEQASSEIRVQLKIMDNNGQAGESGYDIESVHVGETCEIRNATSKGSNLWDVVLWDEDVWDYNITNASATLLQIMSVEYHPDFIIIQLSNRQPDINKRIEDINRNVVDEQTLDNPTTPTT